MKYILISFSFVILLGCSSSDIKIAFVSAPEMYSEATHIHITNDEGTNEVKLTNGDAGNSSPCWSPDNEKSLLFQTVTDLKTFILCIQTDQNLQELHLLNFLN